MVDHGTECSSSGINDTVVVHKNQGQEDAMYHVLKNEMMPHQ